MSINKVSQLVTIGELAVELVEIEAEVIALKDDYRFAIRDYEAENGRLIGKLDANNPDHHKVISYTAPEYSYYRDAVRRKRNIKKRLTNAARKLIAASAH